jgi:exosome complex RNA-binding protein Csl4
MKMVFAAITLTVFLVTSMAYAAGPSPSPATPAHPAGAQTVTGEVLKIEEDQYLIRDSFGKEVRLHVSQQSKIEGSPKVGDKIEARVLEGGLADTISKQ